MKKKIIEMLSERGKLSTMRIMSILMFFVATFYLFYSFKYLLENTKEINVWVVVLHIGQNAINYLFAFMPKVLQKKLEMLDVNKISR